jgi:hypothetical protein
MTSSTGGRIKRVLDGVQEKYGPIRLIVADEGPDIKLGVKLFTSENQRVDYASDIVHKLAHLLDVELNNNSAWLLLNKKTSILRTKLLQSQFAHLIPPQRRDKARYLNLEELIKWAKRVLASFTSLEISEKDREAIMTYFLWIYDIKMEIDFFDELWKIVAITRNLIRTKNITSNTADELASLLSSLSLSNRALEFATKVLDFVLVQSSKAEQGERLLGSSEIIESLIGTFKQRLNSQSRSGFTGSILMTSTLVGEINMIMTREAMEEISANEVSVWADAFIGDTLQKKRKEFHEKTKNNSTDNRSGSMPINGTENGNITTEELLLLTG